MSDWPHWEQWEHGWEVIDGHLHFERTDLTLRIPPHSIEPLPDFDDAVPVGPSVNSNTEPRDWLVRFPFENGWEALVYPEFGLALNGAAIIGLNARSYRGPAWPLDGGVWDDRSLIWQEDEMEALGGSYPHLDDPDHLLRCLFVIAHLPSDR